MAARYQKAIGEISPFSKKEKNYESKTRDETDLNQAGNDKYPLQL